MINSTFTIGITGNIATGKSVIRRMLANLGVFTIDADTIANRMLYPGGAAYQQVLNAFGTGIQSDDLSISNKKLGQIVFNNPLQLKLLESLVHPPVIAAVLQRIKSASRPVAAIEAIKLLESNLNNYCDQVWVSYAAYDHQRERLLKVRGLTEVEASARIKAQAPQIEKLTQADVIINTETTFKDTWLRTSSALNDTIQSESKHLALDLKISKGWSAESVNRFSLNQLEHAWQELTGHDPTSLYECLGMQMTHVLQKNGHIQAFLIWEAWNFTGTLEGIYPASLFETQPKLVCTAFERLAQINQTEIVFIPASLSTTFTNQAGSLGFELQASDQITYPAWKMAAQKAATDQQTPLWCKVLSQPFELSTGLTH